MMMDSDEENSRQKETYFVNSNVVPHLGMTVTMDKKPLTCIIFTLKVLSLVSVKDMLEKMQMRINTT